MHGYRCYSFRIREWVRADAEASNEEARERAQPIVLDMSSEFVPRSLLLLTESCDPS
jgi:hypothetical protein